MARRRSSYYDNYWPTYTRPIDVVDGIRARSKRGKFVKNWWADRWIKALQNLMDAGRLSRGRNYARRGQVREIDVEPGLISAQVQGSRHTPYRVSIKLKPLSDQRWDKVFEALSEQAIYVAQLLNGEMPPDIEQVFDAIQVPLFPDSRGDLKTNCSCPDWANPCKHVAAVYYLMGERFDQDPFLLFELRGRSKDEIFAALRERRVQGTEVEETPYVPDEIEAVTTPALEECLEHYWTPGFEVENVTLRIGSPRVDMALFKRLGVPDFQGITAQSFWGQMKRVYDGVTMNALEVAFADQEIDTEDK
jgi:uncharacterized Zn finger protein